MQHEIVIKDEENKLHLITIDKKIFGKNRMKIEDEEGEREIYKILSEKEYADIKAGKWSEESKVRPPHEDQIKKGWFMLPDVKLKGQNAINIKKMGIKIKKIFEEN